MKHSLLNDIKTIYRSVNECDCGVKPTVLISYRIMCPCCGKSTEQHSASDIDYLIKEWNGGEIPNER